MKEYNVAILGATGAVGTRMIQQLEQSSIPVKQVKLLASPRSAGKVLQFKGQDVTVEATTPESFDDVDIVLASAGGAASKQFLPEAVKRGAVAVDNTSAFRMDPEVPLVVPEVNEDAIAQHKGIIANPNCSTIQMVVALKPIFDVAGLKQIIVSTYQAGSGAGQTAIQELDDEAQQHLNGEPMTADIFPVKSEAHHYPLAFNLLPQIDVFEPDGSTHEEWKMVHETKKIMLGEMNDPKIKVNATCVRVPVVIGHGESVYFEVEDNTNLDAHKVQELIKHGDGLVLEDDPAEQLYPQPINAEGHTDTYVGRVREDPENPGAYNLWVVADNLLKGAAANTVEIAEKLVEHDLVRVPADYYGKE
ncbi:aspartate-semialdehyde dehydrogenase [Fructilactobacillus cliffordii]|uniref:aspartate-semialdehyde dehydrogenase n=1 Tax=Fructilactobacillus cliffordii TaxID=2940299 RepID=UPI0020926180|nr:aspartate-semialdehyde dehydrogenase [Fructilactobacillus cliffordii]USS85900.1 aspartate-semialdehyde dehydrogenase [Fructilactobacillus cliffordii]